MRIAVFSTKNYDRRSLSAAAEGTPHQFTFFEPRLALETAPLAREHAAVCAFVNDQLGGAVLETLAQGATRLIALRCAGFNNVDLDAAARLGIKVARVPAYSPYAVAEHAVGLILALNRHLHRAYNRVRDGNFALDGLVGFDLAGKTVGVVGTGKIGAIVARLAWHFRCEVIAHDPIVDQPLTELGVRYAALDEVWERSHIVTLNCPLTPETHHLVSSSVITRMRPGAMLVNTGRGALIDTLAVIDGLKTGQIGSLALDVYEEEADLFFEDRSGEIIGDDVFARLLTFPNVLITAHQAFLTREALDAIATTTLANLDALAAGEPCPNRLV